MIDTHTHLDQLPTDQLSAVLGRARAAGLTHIVTVGMNKALSEAAIHLAAEHPEVWAAPGIHPWQADRPEAEPELAYIRKLAGEPRVVAIGEAGLDYENNLFTGASYQNESIRERQRLILSEQLLIADEYGLPVILHVRGNAHQDLVTLLRTDWPSGGVVIQFLSGTPEDAASYVKLGCYLSIGGPVTEPTADALRAALKRIPADRLLLETDAPYVPPAWKQGAASEPADVPAIAAFIAQELERPVGEIQATTSANALRLFGFSTIR